MSEAETKYSTGITFSMISPQRELAPLAERLPGAENGKREDEEEYLDWMSCLLINRFSSERIDN